MTSWGRRALAGLVTVVVVGSCIDLGGPASGVASISDLRVPYPAVVIGDILRDSLGAPTPLSLTAYDGTGKVLPTEHVTFFAVDSTITVDSSGFVRGVLRDTAGGRVAASAGNLQTLARRIFVTIQPTSAAKGPGTPEIDFVVLNTDSTNATNQSPQLVVTVSGAGGAGAQGFVVTYQITRSPKPKTPGDQTAYIGDDAALRTSRDTTDFFGQASRRVILRPLALDTAANAVLTGAVTDTIVVHATARYLGVDIPGSPFDFVVPVKKKVP